MAKTAKATEVKEDKSTQDNTSQTDSKKQVQTVEFPDAVETETTAPTGKFDILLDMNVPVTVCLGQTEITVRRLLQLGPGSVLKLNKPIDNPADLYLKDAKFATGDVVIVDGRFAIRIKRIIGIEANSEADQAQ